MEEEDIQQEFRDFVMRKLQIFCWMIYWAVFFSAKSKKFEIFLRFAIEKLQSPVRAFFKAWELG